jgi:hypothetical protein
VALAALAVASCTRADLGAAAALDAGETASTAAPSATAPAIVSGSAPAPHVEALVREQTTVTLDGVAETWRLEWTHAPFPTCRGAAGKTCPCAGFAPGERGDLDLVRERPGAPADRFSLSPLFEAHETIVVAARPDAGAPLLALADYDHDGKASELAFQVGAGPCGHTAWAIIGVSRDNPRLHAFTSAEDPKTPLVLDQRRDWETVRARGSLDTVQVACGDHGADESTSVTVTAKNGVLHSSTRTAACPP